MPQDDGQNTLHATVHLHETSTQISYQYVALSHCWAQSTPLITKVNNFKTHLKQIPWQEMPMPFKQAILLTKLLGFEYIWIDSLCIRQDDKEDWAAEAPRMGAIYNNAILTIGLLGPDEGVGWNAPIKVEDIYNQGNMPIFCRPAIDHNKFAQWSPFEQPIEQSIFDRAWCLQERVLSPRILYIGSKLGEMVFECNEEMKCECGEVNPRGVMFNRLDKPEYARILNTVLKQESESAKDETWTTHLRLCEDYSTRSLTVQSDRLPAISGLMNFFSPFMGDYFAGLWDYNLLRSLCWYTVGESISRPSSYIAPSFSWASLVCPVSWDRSVVGELYNCEVTSISCTPAADELGAVMDGHVTLHGLMIEFEVEKYYTDGSWGGWLDPNVVLKDDGENKDDDSFDNDMSVFEGDDQELPMLARLDTQHDLESLKDCSILFFFAILRTTTFEGEQEVSGLLLNPVRDRDGHYRRAGFAGGIPLSKVEGTVKTKVTII